MPALKLRSTAERQSLPDETEKLRNRLLQERKARIQAEQLLEAKSAELTDASEGLIEQTKRVQSLAAGIEAATDGIAMTKPLGELIYVNSSFGNSFGVGANALLNRHWLSIFSHRLKHYLSKEALAHLQRTETWHGDIIGHTKGNYPLYLDLILNLQPDGSLMLSARDIKHRLDRQVEIRALETKLLKAENDTEMFTHVNAIVHDFNNLIAAITGHALLVQSYMNAEDPAYEHTLQILQATEQATEVVRSVVYQRHNETNLIEEVNLPKLIRAGLSITDSIRPPGVQIELNLSHTASAYTHQVLFVRALINLIQNAFEAMSGRGLLKITLDQGASTPFAGKTEIYRLQQDQIAEDRRHTSVLEVTDTGSGLPHNTLEKIFSPFMTTKAQQKGSGLGLLSLKSLSDTQTVRVEVETCEGLGTCFRLFFLALDPFE